MPPAANADRAARAIALILSANIVALADVVHDRAAYSVGQAARSRIGYGTGDRRGAIGGGRIERSTCRITFAQTGNGARKVWKATRGHRMHDTRFTAT